MIQANTVYDKKWLIGCLIGIVAMCGVMKTTGGAGFVLIFPLILAAFGRNRTELMLYCLLMTAVVTVLNSAIAPKDVIFALSARGVYFLVGTVLTLQIIGQRSSRLTSPLLSLLFFVAYMAIVSSVGWQPMISYLKLILFFIVYMALYSVGTAVATRPEVRPERVRSVFLAFAVFVLVGSVLLIPFPGISVMSAAAFVQAHGYLPDGGLFQGVTFHSQCVGPLVGVLSVLLFADLLFSVRKWDRLYVLLLLCAPILIYKTGSRTAMGTWLAGLFFVSFLFMNASGRTVGAHWKQRALTLLTVVGMLGGVALFATPGMRAAVARFALKYTSEGSSLEVDAATLMTTRQGLIDSQIENFADSPWIGNGFQVSKQLGEKTYSSWEQYLSAPIEKGVWVTAILEEGGVFGMLLFVLFLLIVFPTLIARKAYLGCCALFVFVVANLGEFNLFSMSANGGIIWALIFSGLALDAQRLRQQATPYPWAVPNTGRLLSHDGK